MLIIPVGALLNAASVTVGGTLGTLLGNRASESMRSILLQALGLSALGLAIYMCAANFSQLSGAQSTVVLGCCILGAAIGELLGIEPRLEALARKGGGDKFAEGLISSSVLFCAGAMCFAGALNEGLLGDRSLLYAKSLLDFFTGIVLASAFGISVAVSAIVVLLVEGSITMLAGALHPYITDMFITSFSALGAVLMLGIGINILELKKLRLGNMLPGLILIIPAQLLL